MRGILSIMHIMQRDVDSVATLKRYLKAGSRIALSDGVGSPLGLASPLSAAIRANRPALVMLGWCFAPPFAVPIPDCDIRTFMGGYALREHIRERRVDYVPVRLAALPALLRDVWRPDVLITSLAPVANGFSFGTEVAWPQAVLESGASVLAEVNTALPVAAATPSIPTDVVTVVNEVDRAPIEVASPASDSVTAETKRPWEGSFRSPCSVTSDWCANLLHTIYARLPSMGRD